MINPSELTVPSGFGTYQSAADPSWTPVAKILIAKVSFFISSLANSLLKFIKFNQLESLWMSTNLMCIGEKTSAKLNEIKWKKIFLFNPGEEEFLLYKI